MSKAFEAWAANENMRLAQARRIDLAIELRRGADGRYASERTRLFLACWWAAQAAHLPPRIARSSP
ncbi:MAG: hypothetical protein WC809_18705 [Sinimarinibacterium sp.]|jgi:hypothetical protein